MKASKESSSGLCALGDLPSLACVWFVYRQLAAPAAVWSVRVCLGRLMVGLVCVGFVALLPVVVSPNVVCAAGTSVPALVSCILVGPSAAQCGLSTLIGRVCDGRVAVFCCVRGLGRQRARRPMVPPSRGTPFPFGPVHAWLVWCPPACVWSVYGHVAARAAVWLVRGYRGRLMVGSVCAGSVALLLVVLSSNPACVAGTSVSVLASCVLVSPSVV